jgi:hypothetical protein
MKHTQLLFPALPFLLSAFLKADIANATIINFDGLVDGEDITNQFSEVLFQNAMIATSGFSLNEFQFPPMSGANVAFDSAGPITLDFASPVKILSAYFTYSTPLRLYAFDMALNLVETSLSLYSQNLAQSGDPGSSPNELISISYSAGVKRLIIEGSAAGSSFTMDDLYFSVQNIPAPQTVLLLFLGMGLLARDRFRHGC